MIAKKSRVGRGALALLAGCLVIVAGDRLLGIDLELYWGLQTFNVLWFLDMFVVPLISGVVVALIFGLGGKWLCYFPPLIVRLLSYYNFMYFTSVPEGASLMPMGWWGFFVILAIESAAFGGVAGEIMSKKTYGRMKPGTLERQDDDEATKESSSKKS